MVYYRFKLNRAGQDTNLQVAGAPAIVLPILNSGDYKWHAQLSKYEFLHVAGGSLIIRLYASRN